MTERPGPLKIASFIADQPHIQAAWVDTSGPDPVLRVLYDPAKRSNSSYMPHRFADLPVVYEKHDPFHTLPLTADPLNLPGLHMDCQNEPVQLGTQIQPGGQGWVGTAGAPVHWSDAPDNHAYGFLTNWHVMPGGYLPQGHPAHQPTDFYPPLGFLQRWSQVQESTPNLVDCAIANAYYDGHHTISPQLLEVGPLSPDLVDARPGLEVAKSGRTTGLTQGTCLATGVAVNVDYGDFIATFANQDIFEAHSGDFSAAGDSGSLIFCQANRCPVALLFAGNGAITVGNPMRFVVDTLDVDFRFP
jgi:hypothetical protein